MKKAKALIERGDDGTYGVYLEKNNLPYNIFGDGKTVEEAKEDFFVAYEEMRELFGKEGKKFVECQFEFVYDIASFLSYYSKIISLAGMERLTGVNQGQLSHYVTGRKKPGRKTIEKIDRNLKEFAEDLRQIEFV